VRPKELSVTDITKLIRDPYAIYAKSVLGLRPLNPLEPLPDGRMRGNVLHDIMEHFVKALPPGASAEDARRVLETVATKIMDVAVPWPGTRLHWLERLRAVARDLATNEVSRQSDVTNVWTEIWGRMALPEVGFEIFGKADRIDLDAGGALRVYDYKSGTVPTEKMVAQFERQLPLESMMAAQGAFEGVPAAPVAGYGFIGLGSSGKETFQPMSRGDIDKVREELAELIRQRWMPENGYTSRRAMQSVSFASDYEHLARYGEWDDSSPPAPETVG
jgi:RecB family exonuclease